MPRTVTAPPTDKRYWRALLRRAHPDTGGTHDLFIWAEALRRHVAGDHVEEPPPQRRRDPPRHHRNTSAAERVPFEPAPPFADLTLRALAMAEDLEEPYAGLFFLLHDCVEVGPDDPTLWRQQGQGATYKSLAAAAYKAGMSKYQRIQWYRIAESVPLAQRHLGHVLSKLD